MRMRGTFTISASTSDKQKASCAQISRRTRANASEKVGVRFRYHAACRMPCAGSSRDGQATSRRRTGRATPEWSARSPTGPVHCRCVSTPRWRRTSSSVTSICQRNTNQATICSGATARSVQSSAWVANLVGIADQYPADRHRRHARVVPDAVWEASSTCVPPDHTSERGSRIASGRGISHTCRERGQTLPLHAWPPILLGLSWRRRCIECGIEAQAGNHRHRRGSAAQAASRVKRHSRCLLPRRLPVGDTSAAPRTAVVAPNRWGSCAGVPPWHSPVRRGREQ